jgi:hypothetical protein
MCLAGYILCDTSDDTGSNDLSAFGHRRIRLLCGGGNAAIMDNRTAAIIEELRAENKLLNERIWEVPQIACRSGLTPGHLPAKMPIINGCCK